MYDVRYTYIYREREYICIYVYISNIIGYSKIKEKSKTFFFENISAPAIIIQSFNHQ